MLMISENVWNEIKNIFPKKTTRVGRPPKDPKNVISGILYILTTGSQWRNLPDYYGKSTTVHGWFRIWVKSKLFDKILLTSIRSAVQRIGSPHCFITDTNSAKAPFSNFGGKNPTDRSKRGVKKSLVIDWNRIILSVLVEAANKHDSQLLLPHLDNLKEFLGEPKVMLADSAFDVKKLRSKLANKNVALHAATNVRRNKLKRKIRPKGRWRIEQIFGIQQWNRGIKFCWTKTKDSFLALCQFASSIHNFKLAGIFG